MPELWSRNKEIEFFRDSSKFANPEQLFYLSDDNRYYAYWPKSYKGEKSTLQSRNSLIGNFTEKFTVDLLQGYARTKQLFAIQGVICKSIGLTSNSPADVALCKSKNREQTAENIIAIFEVKMSIVWNWELKNDRLICLGDFKTHRGNPGLLRSDSILKAIGKSATIRAIGSDAARIPIIIFGNTPITSHYSSKVDRINRSGIIQGFWSVNPNPLDNKGENLKKTPNNGFLRIDSYNDLVTNLDLILAEDREYFSAMKTHKELGKIIEIANREDNYRSKAEVLLKLIRN